jgi:hypothetical protein
MTGARCELTVERSLNGLPLVAANADFERGMVEIVYEEARVGADLLRATIESAGYPAEPVWASGPWETRRGPTMREGRHLPVAYADGSCNCG